MIRLNGKFVIWSVMTGFGTKVEEKDMTEEEVAGYEWQEQQGDKREYC